LDPDQLTQCFLSWTTALSDLSGGDIVAIDGKTLRHSFDRAAAKAAIHMVSAWAHSNRLVLGQVKVDDKSNVQEIRWQEAPSIPYIDRMEWNISMGFSTACRASHRLMKAITTSKLEVILIADLANFGGGQRL